MERFLNLLKNPMKTKLRKVKVSAPGKVILSGEHAVVYGRPAIYSAIDKRIHIEICGKAPQVGYKLEKLSALPLTSIASSLQKRVGGITSVNIKSDIPVGSGMGSSAAFSVALVASMSRYMRQDWDLEKINRVAYLMEKKHHGNPSGGDNTVCTYGGFLWYRKELEEYKTFRAIKIAKKAPAFFIIDTGRPLESTKEMVQMVSKRRKNSSKSTEIIFNRIEEITKLFLKSLLAGGGNYSGLIKDNQRLLQELGVVSDSTQKLVKRIESMGGSAKVSGAGGKKGASGILLGYHKDPGAILNFVRKMNLKVYEVRLGEEGVRIE